MYSRVPGHQGLRALTRYGPKPGCQEPEAETSILEEPLTFYMPKRRYVMVAILW